MMEDKERVLRKKHIFMLLRLAISAIVKGLNLSVAQPAMRSLKLPSGVGMLVCRIGKQWTCSSKMISFELIYKTEIDTQT